MLHHWPYSPFHDKRIDIRDVIAVLERLSPQPEEKDFYNPFTIEIGTPLSAEEILRGLRALNEPLLSAIPSASYTPGSYDVYGIWGDGYAMDVSQGAVPDTPLTSEASSGNLHMPLVGGIKEKRKGSKQASALPRKILKPRGPNTKYRDDASYRTKHTLRPAKETAGSRNRKGRRP